MLWLKGFDGMDIRCVQLVAYEIDGKNYLDIEQVIPLPQAADYQVQIGKKAQQQKKAREGGADWTRYQIIIDGEPGRPLRKRQAMLTMIRTLHQKGIGLDAISGTAALAFACDPCTPRGPHGDRRSAPRTRGQGTGTIFPLRPVHPGQQDVRVV